MAIDLVTRREWGAREPRGSYSRLSSTKGVKVHYTGGQISPGIVNDHAKCVALVKSIQNQHMDGNGWIDVGYSLLVCPHRKVFEGRGLNHLPAANGAGLNSGHYAVLGLVGSSGLTKPTDDILNGILDAIEYLRDKGGAGKEIKGHRDGYATSCLPLDTTEVLTRRGWTNLVDVAVDDEIASWSMDSSIVTFDRAVSVVEPYEAKTMIIDGFETTPDHNWVTYGQRAWAVGCSCGFEGSPTSIRAHGREGRRRGENHETLFEKRWKFVRADRLGQDFVYPRAVHSSMPGLEMTDDQIRLMVWLQGDGHFMKESRGATSSVYGVEWHLRKPRKITRLTALLRSLEIPFRQNPKSDGTVSIRVYGDDARAHVIPLLPAKRFHWGLLDMSPSQAETFLEELMHVDGCEAGSYYSSAEEVNLDVVQAIAILNGRSAVLEERLVRLRSGKENSQWRGLTSTFEEGRATRVGCLTTVNGTLVIRQHGRAAVIGNCPGEPLYAWIKQGAPRPGIGPVGPPEPHPSFSGRVLEYPPVMSGEDVRTWQAQMDKRGWDIDVDGLYGPGSRDVCRTFQQEKDLPVTGTVDRVTWNATWEEPIS